MASIEEKLHNFSKTVYSTAQKQCDDIRAAAKEETEKALSEYKDKCLEKSYNDIQKQLKLAQKEADGNVSKQKAAAKYDYAKKRQQMLDELFSLSYKKFADFKLSGDYAGFLTQAVESAIKNIDSETKYTIYLDFEDAQYKSFLEEKFSLSEVCVLPADDRIMGGVRIIPKNSNRVIDNSVAEAFDSEKKIFLGSGKLS